MKSLVVLLAFVALSKAGGTDDFQACAKEAIDFKQCVFHEIANRTARNFQELKAFGQEIQKCFELDGVKGVCIPPTPPPRGALPPPGPLTPPPQFAACFAGAKQAFFTCFKKEAGIPDDFKPPTNISHPPGPFGPPPYLQHHFPHESPEAIKQKVLELCGNNQAAADKLTACVKEAIKPHLPALIATRRPILVACHAAAVCNNSQPISADCRARLAQGRKAFCTCRPEFPKFFNTSDDCAAARAAFKEHAAVAKPAEDAVAAHHDIPHHPEQPFDFCAQPQESVCSALREKFQAAHASFGVAPAPSA